MILRCFQEQTGEEIMTFLRKNPHLHATVKSELRVETLELLLDGLDGRSITEFLTPGYPIEISVNLMNKSVERYSSLYVPERFWGETIYWDIMITVKFNKNGLKFFNRSFVGDNALMYYFTADSMLTEYYDYERKEVVKNEEKK